MLAQTALLARQVLALQVLLARKAHKVKQEITAQQVRLALELQARQVLKV